jgi:osmotically-inducible protein OsmY
MRKPLSTSTLATALTLGALALSPAVLAQSTQQDLTDTRQESQIWTSYALSPYLRNSDLKVSVHDGQATLTGHVEDSIDSDLAKQIALGVVGVNQVDNQIIIDTNYVAPVMPADG